MYAICQWINPEQYKHIDHVFSIKGGVTTTDEQSRAANHVHTLWDDSRCASSQWETALLCNDVSHWLGASLEAALYFMRCTLGWPRQNNKMRDSQWLLTDHLHGHLVTKRHKQLQLKFSQQVFRNDVWNNIIKFVDTCKYYICLFCREFLCLSSYISYAGILLHNTIWPPWSEIIPKTMYFLVIDITLYFQTQISHFWSYSYSSVLDTNVF